MSRAQKPKRIRFDVFGKLIVAEQRSGQWQLFNDSNDGKLVPIRDVIVPPGMSADELLIYLDDLFHELATLENSQVKQLPYD